MVSRALRRGWSASWNVSAPPACHLQHLKELCVHGSEKNEKKGALRPKTHLKPIYLYLPHLQYYSSKSKNISTIFWSKQFCIGWIDNKSF